MVFQSFEMASCQISISSRLKAKLTHPSLDHHDRPHTIKRVPFLKTIAEVAQRNVVVPSSVPGRAMPANTSAYCDNASEAFTGLRVSNDLNILFSTSISMVIGYIRQGIATTTTPWEYTANHGL